MEKPKGRFTTALGRSRLPDGIQEALCIVAMIMLAVWVPCVRIAADEGTGAGRSVDFRRDVQPVLRRYCVRCHGTREAEGGVRFTSREAALSEGDSGEAIIVPGKPDESLLVNRLVDDDYGDLMPLDGEPLSDTQVSTIRRWIAAGADWPEEETEDQHWAYVRPRRPPLPSVGDANWPTNAIDFFVLSRLQGEGLKPREPAERARLIRRVSLALTGLPPSVADVEAFVADDSPDAYERLVDRLLDSPRYGERWAQPWLDLARYADSNGFQADQLRDSWGYRDWVIRALNQDLPFDQFVVHQLAGDLLPEATPDQRIATGFHRTTTCNVEAGVHPEENRVNQVFDRVNTTGTVFLGTTLECCQCHDHKYDPFTMKDYYQLFAYFNNTPLEVKLASGVQYDFVGPKMELSLPADEQEQRDVLQRKLESTAAAEQQVRRREMEDFPQWENRVRHALASNPARWQPLAIDDFQSNGGEDFELLEDGSVLLSGSVPGTAIYTITCRPPPAADVLGFKIETLTHDSLPGSGPGRGDAERANFVLSEFSVSVERAGKSATSVALHSPVADFSQKGWEIAKAIDGDRKTGWGIAPEFHKPHWATFRTGEPLRLTEGDALVLSLDQNLGRGRTIGCLRVTVMVGDELTADIPEDIRSLLKKTNRKLKELERLKAYFAGANPELQKLAQEMQRIRNELKRITPPTTLVMVEMDQRRTTCILNRGNYLDQGEDVACGTPEVLHPPAAALPNDRLGLARWLASKDNPLLARVTVNRWWSQLLGRGIVSTPEDFGTQCEPPTHPELLDWLAVEFMESGWSAKHIHRLMVCSSTFRQSATVSADLMRRDPENELFARGPRFRLPAETIRDNALAVSGLLCTEMYGPPVMPFQPAGVWKSIGRNQPTWKTAVDNDRFRRGVYVVWKRAAPYPSFVNFDAPDRAACMVQRPRTNTPLQALTLLNDPAYAEMAMALAARIMTETPDATPDARAEYGFRLCVARCPDQSEIDALTRLYQSEFRKIQSSPAVVQKRMENLLPRLRNAELDQRELAAWFSVANVLLNLDETMSY